MIARQRPGLPMSAPQSGHRSEVLALAALAGPLVVNNLSIAGMNFADAVMAGRLGTRDLAAVAVGGGVWMVGFLFGLGVLMAMSPVCAQAYGAGRNRDVGEYLRQGLWLALGLATIVVLAVANARPVLTVIGIDPDLIPLTAGYLRAMSFGLPAMYAYLALRFMSEGIGWTRPIMLAAVVALVVNVAGNWVLMYGKLGFPAMGAVGCGASSALAMWSMLLTMLVYVRRHRRYRPFSLWGRFEWPDPAKLRDLLGVGLPIGGSVVAEAGLFSAASLLMGRMGATQVAAHQIAINYAATMFMVPLAIHSAITIRVGHSVGAGRTALARRQGITGIVVCGLFMTVSALMLLLFRDHITGLYTRDAAVQSVAISLLTMAMIFQVSDGLQVGAAGALRGFKDTRVPMLLNVIAYWVIAFPLAWYLGVYREAGPQGVWVALVVGLTAGAALLNLRFLRISRDPCGDSAPVSTSTGMSGPGR
jgi:MATE family multidrug resistance protein